MAGVYVVLGVGLVLSFLVLIAEIAWKRKLKLKAKKVKVSQAMKKTLLLLTVSKSNLIFSDCRSLPDKRFH